MRLAMLVIEVSQVNHPQSLKRDVRDGCWPDGSFDLLLIGLIGVQPLQRLHESVEPFRHPRDEGHVGWLNVSAIFEALDEVGARILRRFPGISVAPLLR